LIETNKKFQSCTIPWPELKTNYTNYNLIMHSIQSSEVHIESGQPLGAIDWNGQVSVSNGRQSC